jgi:hypothetical protein
MTYENPRGFAGTLNRIDKTRLEFLSIMAHSRKGRAKESEGLGGS